MDCLDENYIASTIVGYDKLSGLSSEPTDIWEGVEPIAIQECAELVEQDELLAENALTTDKVDGGKDLIVQDKEEAKKTEVLPNDFSVLDSYGIQEEVFGKTAVETEPEKCPACVEKGDLCPQHGFDVQHRRMFRDFADGEGNLEVFYNLQFVQNEELEEEAEGQMVDVDGSVIVRYKPILHLPVAEGSETGTVYVNDIPRCTFVISTSGLVTITNPVPGNLHVRAMTIDRKSGEVRARIEQDVMSEFDGRTPIKPTLSSLMSSISTTKFLTRDEWLPRQPRAGGGPYRR